MNSATLPSVLSEKRYNEPPYDAKKNTTRILQDGGDADILALGVGNGLAEQLEKRLGLVHKELGKHLKERVQAIRANLAVHSIGALTRLVEER